MLHLIQHLGRADSRVSGPRAGDERGPSGSRRQRCSRRCCEGWERQQRARFLSDGDDRCPGLRLLRRFDGVHQPVSVAVDARGGVRRSSLICGAAEPRSRCRRLAGTSWRSRLFCEYLTDARYGWPRVCLERFGEVPQQVLHEWNTVTALGEYEGDPRRRPLTYDEVQALFDAADGRVERDPRRRAARVRWRRCGTRRCSRPCTRSGYAATRSHGSIWPICGTTRRPRTSGGSGAVSSATARRKGRAAEAPHGADGPGDGLGDRRCWSTG